MTTVRRIRNIIRAYGTESTICYYYYLHNVVDYCGEERVRKSFESIKGQGNEIIVGDYCSTDDTKKIAEEYGFKVLDVEEDERFLFAESKIRNKVILESESNFIVALNINVEYPEYLTSFIKGWLRSNDIGRSFLSLRTNFEDVKGRTHRFYGFSAVIYKPYLIEARGYNELTSYGAGSQKYGIMLLKDVFGLRANGVALGMVHKYHNHLKLPTVRKLYPNITYANLKRRTRRLVGELRLALQKDYHNEIKKVENSYW